MYTSLETIEAWPTPNYVNPQRHAPTLYIIHGVFYPLAVLMLAIRMYTRIYISHSVGLDDYLILIGFIPLTAFVVVSILVAALAGWDIHEWDVPLDSVTTGLRYIYITQILFVPAVTLIRLSMFSLICRLFSNGAVRLRRFTIAMMIYLSIHGSLFTITIIFQCRPVHDYWKLTFEPQDNCINETANLLVTSIFNSATDFIAVLLPIPTVWALQMPSRQKAFVSILFLVGLLTSTASIVRVVYVYQATSGSDRTWATYTVFMWSSVEVYLGIFCACLPPSTGFFKRFFPNIFESIHNGSKPWSKNPHWGSKSTGSGHGAIELADTDDDERRIMPLRDFNHSGITTDITANKGDFKVNSAAH